jgi:hypothetical protein
MGSEYNLFTRTILTSNARELVEDSLSKMEMVAPCPYSFT